MIKKSHEKIVAALVLIMYLLGRMALDPVLWRDLSPYHAYAFEVVLVGSAFYFFRRHFSLAVPRLGWIVPAFVLSLAAGHGIHDLATYSHLVIPFDLQDKETVLLLLLVAPLLEEMIFRMAIMDALGNFIKKEAFVLIISSMLFALGHLQAMWVVPHEFRIFVLYQTLYTTLLGLGAGWARMETKSLFAPVIVHFGFNLGFYLGSLN